MFQNVLVVGAGSIGNHMSHASRCLGINVTVFDIDASALERMKMDIYPDRYGQWDNTIFLSDNLRSSLDRHNYDLVVIGTPPDTHYTALLSVLEHRPLPKVVLVEKPLIEPSASRLAQFEQLLESFPEIRFFVGYDHLVGVGYQTFLSRAIESKQALNRVDTELNVIWREDWSGIFAAHPWISSLAETYLGATTRGGGALCEHSHGLSMWMATAQALGFGEVVSVRCVMDERKQSSSSYDEEVKLMMTTDNGYTGSVVQDVKTSPKIKQIKLSYGKGSLVWDGSKGPHEEGVYNVPVSSNNAADDVSIRKNRPDDFIAELCHVHDAYRSGEPSIIDIGHAMSVMRVIIAAFKSYETGLETRL